MSVYIPGMEMPTSCAACPCSYDNQCAVTNQYPTYEEWYESKPTWCPLVPVPDHGRLIDADALCDKLEKAMKIKPYLEGAFNAAISFALTAPTIIPADKEVE